MTSINTLHATATATGIIAQLDAGMEITRDNAVDVLDALGHEAAQARADFDLIADHIQRAALYQRAAINQERQALAYELRPGRARDKAGPAALNRWGARLCAAGAEIERFRARAATHGRDLPDPRMLLADLHDDRAVEALLRLYTLAASPQ